MARIYHNAFRLGTLEEDERAHTALNRIKVNSQMEPPRREAIEAELTALHNAFAPGGPRVRLSDPQMEALVALMRDPREPCVEHFPHQQVQIY